MSFFEPAPRRPTAEVAPTVVTSPPAWEGPPHDVLPGIAAVELIVARTEETAVGIAGVEAYSSRAGTWSTGYGHCRRLDRSRSSVSGRRGVSRSLGPRSTPGRSSKRPGAPWPSGPT